MIGIVNEFVVCEKGVCVVGGGIDLICNVRVICGCVVGMLYLVMVFCVLEYFLLYLGVSGFFGCFGCGFCKRCLLIFECCMWMVLVFLGWKI